MGTEEESTPAKPSKATASTQEIPPTPSYPDWSSPMQAYYGAGATPFFASTVASATPHPYIWGGQVHSLMPPYGSPVPYPAMYPPGGLYAHPILATAPSLALNNADNEGKSADGKDRGATKKSEGTSGSKVGEGRKMVSGSGNDGGSQSESGSEGTSDGSEENSQQELAAGKKGSFDLMLIDANAQNNSAGAVQNLVSGKPFVSIPATTLNIGMDLWSGSPAGTGAAKMGPNASGAAATVAPGGVMHDQCFQDERELKRQRRKQSNRESARRSRLRKQAECEELQARVESLVNENHNLSEELKKLCDECEKLTSENSSIKDELTRIYGPDAVTNLEQDDPSSILQSQGDEGNS